MMKINTTIFLQSLRRDVLRHILSSFKTFRRENPETFNWFMSTI